MFLSSGKQARFTLNFCPGMPLQKVHELTFRWFGLPGPLLKNKEKPSEARVGGSGTQKRLLPSLYLQMILENNPRKSLSGSCKFVRATLDAVARIPKSIPRQSSHACSCFEEKGITNFCLAFGEISPAPLRRVPLLNPTLTPSAERSH